MTAASISDLSITVNQRRWACVLDPALAISEYGLPLVKQLGELIELWIVREFWHILDNTQFFLRQPEVILGQPTALSSQQQTASQQAVRALQEWERLRTTSDRNTWKINFLADVLGESCVPAGVDTDIIWRWESLAQNLDIHLDNQPTKADTLALAYRDLAALAAARPACVLTFRSAEASAKKLPPNICKTLEQWKIKCQEIEPADAIVSIERDQFRRLLVNAGLSKLLWAGLDLVVLHLVVPAAATLVPPTKDWSEDFAFPEMEEPEEAQANLWKGAQGFWYSVQ